MLPHGLIAPLVGAPLLGLGSETAPQPRARRTPPQPPCTRDGAEAEYARLLARANDVEGPPPQACAVVPCPPALLRCTTACVPCGPRVLPRGALPLTVAMCPLALPTPDAPFFHTEAATEAPAEEVPLVPADAQTGGPVRCAACGAFINPYVVFGAGGREWACAVCGAANAVPAAYRSVLCRETGQRRDLALRPELTHGAVEYVAGPEHTAEPRTRAPPCHVLVVDVSRAARAAGVAQAVGAALARWLATVAAAPPGAPARRARLGLVLCARRVTLVDLRARRGTARPLLLSLAPADCPLFGASDSDAAPAVLRPDCGCACVAECLAPAQFAAEHLAEMGGDGYDDDTAGATGEEAAAQGTALFPAIAVARALVARSGGSGQIHVVTHTPARPCRGLAVPVRSASALESNNSSRSSRSSRSSSGSSSRDKGTRVDAVEAELAAAPAKESATGAAVARLAAELCGAGATVHVYAAGSGAHLDLATLAVLAERTGGAVWHDGAVAGAAHTARLGAALVDALARDPARQAWAAVVRLRVPRALRVAQCYGSGFCAAPGVLAPGAPCPASTATALLQHVGAGTLDPARTHALQCTLVYTTGDGRRRVRVCTLPLAASAAPADVYAALDADCLVAGVVRMAAAAVFADRRALADVAAGVVARTRTILAAAATATHTPAGTLPAGLETLPLYMLALLKSRALAHGPQLQPRVTPDARAAALHALRTLPVPALLLALHPQLCDLAPLLLGEHNEGPHEEETPLPLLPLTAASLRAASAYLLDAGDTLAVYCPPEAAAAGAALLGACTAEGTVGALPVVDTRASGRLRALVAARVRARVAAGLARPQLVVLRTPGPRLAQHLVADRGRNVADYETFLRAVLAPA